MPFIYQVFQFFIFTMGRFGVPLFFMLTGYLLLTRDYNTKEKIIGFYKKNFLRLVIVWYIWILLYNIFLLVFYKKPFVIEDVLLELLNVKKVPLIHAWYMQQIIVIYAILPLLSYYLKKIKKLYKIKMLIMGILLLSTINYLCGGIHLLNFICSKSMYIAYVIAGYYYAVCKSHPDKRICWLFLFIGFSIIVGWQIYSYHIINPYNLRYDNPLHYIVSLSLVTLLFTHNWVKNRFSNYIEKISRISFAIYLLHVPAMLIILSILPFMKEIAIANVILLYLCTLFVCISIILTLSKQPLIRKYLFYIK